MSQSLMPQIGGDGGKQGMRLLDVGGGAEWVQITRAVTSEEHRPGNEILNREAKWVK